MNLLGNVKRGNVMGVQTGTFEEDGGGIVVTSTRGVAVPPPFKAYNHWLI